MVFGVDYNVSVSHESCETIILNGGLMTGRPIVWKHAKGLTYTSPFLTFPDVQSTVLNTESILKSQEWKVATNVIWGMKDRWLPFEGVAQYCREIRADLLQLSEVILSLILRSDGNKVTSS